VVAYGVSQRAQEFGIRVALGAARGQLVRQVMGPAAVQIGAGGVVGVVVAALALPLAGTVLAVSPRDPLTYTLCTVTLVSLALVALYLPARRAANAEPMRALRRD
jgi:ABC-type antimicrobial peptide transport system permease subunit